jgi:uncharacterized OB-fold protein
MPTIVPAIDADNEAFWAAAKRHELAICRCRACGRAIHLPRGMCPACSATDPVWEVVPGTGSLYSWTTVERQVHPSFPTPYTVVLVAVSEEPSVRLVSHLPGRPDLKVGMAMVLWFEELESGHVLPQWRPA